MSALDDLAARVTALEQELATTRVEVAEARALAAGADRDVADYRAEVRAQTRLIGALRDTQVEQGRTLAEHGAELTAVRTDVAEIKGGIRHIVTLLEGLTE